MNRKKNKALSSDLAERGKGEGGRGKVVCLTSQSHVSNKMSTKQLSYLFGHQPAGGSRAFNFGRPPEPEERVPGI